MNKKKIPSWHNLAQPKFVRKCARILLLVGVILMGVGLSLGLYLGVNAPLDYQQEAAFKIMYIHVPCAWLGLMIYVIMAVIAFIGLVWRHQIYAPLLKSLAPLGCLFTALCLITGMLWGKPMWGTYWVWGDARLLSMFLLLMLYVGYFVVNNAFQNQTIAAKLSAYLILIGVINIPIIKFSVEWWHTLHQKASISSFERLVKPSMPVEMYLPLLFMFIGLLGYTLVFANMRLLTLLKKKQKPKTLKQQTIIVEAC